MKNELNHAKEELENVAAERNDETVDATELSEENKKMKVDSLIEKGKKGKLSASDHVSAVRDASGHDLRVRVGCIQEDDSTGIDVGSLGCQTYSVVCTGCPFTVEVGDRVALQGSDRVQDDVVVHVLGILLQDTSCSGPYGGVLSPVVDHRECE